MNFEDGLYFHNYSIVIVFDGYGRAYSLDYAGDLGDWECYLPNGEQETDVSDYDTVPEMFAGVSEFEWQPAEDEIEFFPADELPFDDFPPIDEDKPYLSATTDPETCPLLAWAYDMGFIHR